MEPDRPAACGIAQQYSSHCAIIPQGKSITLFYFFKIVKIEILQVEDRLHAQRNRSGSHRLPPMCMYLSQHSDGATVYTTDESWFDSWQGQDIFSLLQSIHTAHWADGLILSGHWVLSLRENWPEHEVDHIQTSSAEVKHQCSCTDTPPI